MPVINGTDGDDTRNGGPEADQIFGFEGNDQLYGGGGDDEIHGGAGDDNLFGDDGNDQLWGDDGNDLLRGGEGDDILDGGTGGGQLDGEGGNDIIYRRGSESVSGGAGDDLVILQSTLIGNVYGNTGNDRLRLDFATSTSGIEANLNLMWIGLYGTVGLAHVEDFEALDGDIIGSAFDDNITIGVNAPAAVIMRLGDGNDQANAGNFDDTLYGGNGNDSLSGLDGIDTLYGEDGNDDLYGGAGADHLLGGAGADDLEGEAGDDVLDGGEGNNTLNGGDGNDVLTGLDGADTLNGGQDNDILMPGGGANAVDGGGGDDVIRLVGGSGWLAGGAGNDLVTFDLSGSTGPQVIDLSAVWSGGSGQIGGYSNVTGIENLYDGTYNLGSGHNDFVTIGAGYTGQFWFDAGAGNDTVTGGNGNDRLIGGSGDDQLNGLGGTNVLTGGIGNDTYIVANTTTTLVELAGEGTDTVRASISWTLADNFENLTLTSGNQIVATGNELNNVLTGVTGNNYFHGLGGDDIINAGGGSDTIYGGDGNDVINTGEGLLNLAYGGYGDDIITGGSQEDTLIGSQGDDQIFGGGGDDNLSGSEGNDILDGGAGIDNAYGSFGNDLYIIDVSGDVIYELVGQGTDTAEIRAWVDYTLGANVERGRYADGFYGTLTGNDLDNELIGAGNLRAGVETLIGGGGNDTLWYGAYMRGGTGNDTYVMPIVPGTNGTSYGVVTELANEGYDTIKCRLTSFAVPDNVEACYNDTWAMTGSLTGNALDNLLTTSGIGDTIHGMGGDDVLVGHASEAVDIRLYGDEGNDRLVDSQGGGILDGGDGIDTADFRRPYFDEAHIVSLVAGTAVAVVSGTTDVLVSIENVIGSSWGDTLIGNAGANSLSGDGGNDLLTGGAGADALDGGNGEDTASYAGSGAGVTIRQDGTASSGGDAQGDVLVSVENVIGSAHNDVFYGSSADNVLSGGDGNDVFAGGLGADTMDGGAGTDRVSYSQSTSAVVIRQDGTASSGGFAQGDILLNIETVTGSNYNDVFYGSTGSDTLQGLGGNDTFAGGLGADTMDGGSGIDRVSYSQSTAAVVVRQDGTASSGGFAQGDILVNIETVTGSAYNDVFYGSTGSDTLQGLAGNDTFAGGLGADTMDGGSGIDRVSYSQSTAAVSVRLDGVASTGGFAEGDILLGVENVTGSGYNDIVYGGAADNVLEGLQGFDILNGQDGNDTLVGGLGGDTLDGGNGIDTASYAGSISGVTVRQDGTASSGGEAQGDVLISVENVIGSAYNDVFYGSTADNVLSGGGGDDTFAGGLGADTMDGGSGIDRVSYSQSTAGVTVHLDGTASSGGFAQGDILVNIETVTGSGYNDTLYGNAADNLLQGLGGNDVLVGGAGNDTLQGGNGADRFVFAGASGTDVISDFAVSGGDMVELDSSLFTDFADVMTHTTDTAGGAVISKGGVTITLTGVTKAQLSAGHFDFVASAPVEPQVKAFGPLTLPGVLNDDPLVLPGEAEAKPMGPLTLIPLDDGPPPPLDPQDPLVLPVGLDAKAIVDDIPIICPTGTGGGFSLPDDLGPNDLALVAGQRDDHWILQQPRWIDWVA